MRYVARPAVALERLALTPAGNVRYTLKTPYRDGTTQVLFEPFDFLSRLAALVPLPRIHLVRYHGVFASASTLRAAVTPAGRGRGAPRREPPSSHPPKHISLTWMKRLKRVFGIEIERCRRCGGALKVIASIEDPGVIERILAHRQSTSEEEGVAAFAARAPPQPPLL